MTFRTLVTIRGFVFGLALFAATFGVAQSRGPEVEAYVPGQAAADILKEMAGADGAFIAAGLLDSKKYQVDNLAKMINFANETVVVVTLTGTQVKQAFERSLSLFPQPNWGFLQISGFEVTFNPDAPANQRVKSITVNGARFDEGKNYRIAMHSGLASGGYGYFKIWNEKTVQPVSPSITVEKALEGRRLVDSRPRWVAQS